MNAETPGNSTTNFLRMVLLSLCANFNPQYLEGEVDCKLRPEYFYQLRALKGKTLKFTTLQVSRLVKSRCKTKNGILI